MAIRKKLWIRALERVQGTRLYRILSHHGGKKIRIKAASDAEWSSVGAKLDPHHSDSSPPGHRGSSNFIALDQGRIIGHVQLVRKPDGDPTAPEYWLFNLSVRIRHRRKGIGEALTRHVIAAALKEEASELRLLVFKNNLPAIRLYRNLGFEPKIDPELEPRLEREIEAFGVRRILLTKAL